MLFHAFPGGRTGAGLLLLRVALGTSVLIQAGAYLAGRSDSASEAWIAGLLSAAAGISLLIGLVTPWAAALAGVLAGAARASVIPLPDTALAPSVTLLAAIAIAVVLLGPGAYSLDARLFGLREIIIPKAYSGQSHD
jgi:hypothetical protein